MTDAKILIIDDNEAVLKTLKLLLSTQFSSVAAVNNPQVIPALLSAGGVDVVLLDMNFGRGQLDGHEGLFWLDRIKNGTQTPPPSVVLITAFGDIELAVASLKNGADDFVQKPWDNERLIALLNDAVDKRRQEMKHIAQKRDDDEQGACALILRSMLKRYAAVYAKPLPVLSHEATALLLAMCGRGEFSRVQDTIERTMLLAHSSQWEAKDLMMPKMAETGENLTLEGLEKQFILSVLKESDHNLLVASQQLGISRQTLYNKMKKYGIE